MNDLRERLQEAAAAAAREGRRPSAAALVERGRRRRLGQVGGTAALLVLALAAMVRDVATELARCRGGDADEMVLVAWARAHGQTWLIEAKPPRPGENWLCWATDCSTPAAPVRWASRAGPTLG